MVKRSVQMKDAGIPSAKAGSPPYPRSVGDAGAISGGNRKHATRAHTKRRKQIAADSQRRNRSAS